ncbi:hypothetical protein VTK26DRAFT_4083 [Humicola hyalothermophila]
MVKMTGVWFLCCLTSSICPSVCPSIHRSEVKDVKSLKVERKKKKSLGLVHVIPTASALSIIFRPSVHPLIHLPIHPSICLSSHHPSPFTQFPSLKCIVYSLEKGGR